MNDEASWSRLQHNLASLAMVGAIMAVLFLVGTSSLFSLVVTSVLVAFFVVLRWIYGGPISGLRMTLEGAAGLLVFFALFIPLDFALAHPTWTGSESEFWREAFYELFAPFRRWFVPVLIGGVSIGFVTGSLLGRRLGSGR